MIKALKARLAAAKAAIDAYVVADAALAEVYARDLPKQLADETPEFTAANSAAWDALEAIPWWARWYADRASVRVNGDRFNAVWDLEAKMRAQR